MEGDPQSAAPVAEPADSAPAPQPASAPSGMPFSLDDALDGASNRSGQPSPAPADPAPSATPAVPDQGAAPAPDGAPTAPQAEDDATPPTTAADGQREAQPGSRRSAAAEVTDLREQVKTVMSELEAERTAKADREAADAKAKADSEAAVADLLGKPGEFAELLQKRAVAQRSGNWADFTQDDEDRLTRLTEGASLYQPLLARARAEAEAMANPLVAETKAESARLMQAWAGQYEAAAALNLPGVDADVLRKSADIPALVRTAHEAGAASRQGEIDDLKGQLTDAKSRAFTSQPQPARGGVSGAYGRGDGSWDPSRPGEANLDAALAGSGSRNGSGR